MTDAPPAIETETPDTITTIDRVKAIVIDHLCFGDVDIDQETTFIDQLGADSLDTVELAMAFEEEFDILLPDAEFAKILNVRDAVTYIDAVKEKEHG